MSSSPLNHFLNFAGNLSLWIIIVQVIRQRLHKRYPAVIGYAIGAALSAPGQTITRYLWGVNWASGLYYVYSESLQTVLLFLALAEFMRQVMEELELSRHLRIATLILLSLTAALSWWKVEDVRDNMTPRFCMELILNLNFIGMIVAILLWWSVVKLKETRARLIHLSLVLGVYFSAQAVGYGVSIAVPSTNQYTGTLMQFVGVSLPVAWAFTFTVIPETARLSPARVSRPAP